MSSRKRRFLRVGLLTVRVLALPICGCKVQSFRLRRRQGRKFGAASLAAVKMDAAGLESGGQECRLFFHIVPRTSHIASRGQMGWPSSCTKSPLPRMRYMLEILGTEASLPRLGHVEPGRVASGPIEAAVVEPEPAGALQAALGPSAPSEPRPNS